MTDTVWKINSGFTIGEVDNLIMIFCESGGPRLEAQLMSGERCDDQAFSVEIEFNEGMYCLSQDERGFTVHLRESGAGEAELFFKLLGEISRRGLELRGKPGSEELNVETLVIQPKYYKEEPVNIFAEQPVDDHDIL
jgi:hypothetical protein